MWNMARNAAPSLNAFVVLFLTAVHGLDPFANSSWLASKLGSPKGCVHLQTPSDTGNEQMTANDQVRRASQGSYNGVVVLSAETPDGLARPSVRTNRHLRTDAEGNALRFAQRGPGSPAVLCRRRRKRNQAVDSSDPLCLHNQRGRCSPSQKEERAQEPVPDLSEQSRAVSKETIAPTSDDPFHVVQPPGGPGSPRSVGSEKALTKKRTASEEGGGVNP